MIIEDDMLSLVHDQRCGTCAHMTGQLLHRKCDHPGWQQVLSPQPNERDVRVGPLPRFCLGWEARP